MTTLIEVVNSLFGARVSGSPGRSMSALGDGAIHLEFPEDDHVYLVTVRQIPRTVLPLDRPVALGELAGVPFQLVRVAVANHVEVTLDAAAGPARDAALGAYQQLFRQWEQDGDVDRHPPAWPAEQLRAVPSTVSDDVGTVYRFQSGEAGGPGTEFRARSNYLPTPPAGATALSLRFTPRDGAPVEVELPLP
ncbi:hypothetical protein ODJ79_21425 [Actinoplanes sp. KI2]|uniref:hypothetical protein n=1 Tax=Actinoplanes sp. KI2 TaxID=2983315 RepID=UPI0021D60901|nr:hypothetical protein [Actinoplanes sp. KI2]MCU7726298.1 hypothetical protein [Actinoplanes sp. KI2]